MRSSGAKLLAIMLTLIFAPAGAAGAGELSDSIMFGNFKAMKMHGFQGAGRMETLTGRVGTVNERMSCWVCADSFSITLKKRAGQAARLQVQEVYPPDAPGTRYKYQVFANSNLVYIRDYSALMFSRVSYFIDLDTPDLAAANKVSVKFVNIRSGSPIRISAAWLYSDFDGYYKSASFETPFYLTPLLGGRSGDDMEEEFIYLKSNIRPRPNSDVKLGCAEEHHYMNRDATATRKQFEYLLKFSRKYNMPLELAFVSWWSGTPMWYPDGKGGKFSDPEYQQICWSETDTNDDGPALKKLLGNKWDIRYGLTVPNRWSSTPWLTMNHPRLNAARAKAIADHLAILAELMKDPQYKSLDKYLLALEMENEPRYWDLHCPDEKYPVKRTGLMADFNPVTVAAAAKDGIKLNPSDGLDYKERLWLHNNVARYQQGTYEAHERALKKLRLPFMNSSTDSLWHEVYSHAFPQLVFPMEQVSAYHPGLEWNRLNRCRAGLEDLSRPATACLDVTREWGRWAQVNYEENNGLGKEWHVRALRAAYAYGARFYNFYNWQSINKEGGWTQYVQEFCKDEPNTRIYDRPTDPAASYVKAASHGLSVDLPAEWSTLNEVRLCVDTPGEYMLGVYDGEAKERVLGCRRKMVDKPGLIIFDLPNSTPVDDRRSVYLTLTRNDEKSYGLLTNPDGKPVVSLYNDAARERAQSLLICWRADAQSLISELKSKSVGELDRAEELLRLGDYRRAYEEAARLETTAL